MTDHTQFPFDERIYTVTGPNGFRKPNLKRQEADDLARRMHAQMQTQGWAGTVRVVYRDGTIVWAGKL